MTWHEQMFWMWYTYSFSNILYNFQSTNCNLASAIPSSQHRFCCWFTRKLFLAVKKDFKRILNAAVLGLLMISSDYSQDARRQQRIISIRSQRCQAFSVIFCAHPECLFMMECIVFYAPILVCDSLKIYTCFNWMINWLRSVTGSNVGHHHQFSSIYFVQHTIQ